MTDKKNSVSNDNRGVSPVIGVILMVAITVILAAVIGGFVLGLGDSLNQTPQSQIQANYYSAGNDGVELSHNGGDPIPAEDLDIQFGSNSAEAFETRAATDWSGQEFQVGDTAQFESVTYTDGEVRVRLIHTPSNSIILDTTVDAP